MSRDQSTFTIAINYETYNAPTFKVAIPTNINSVRFCSYIFRIGKYVGKTHSGISHIYKQYR